ncbi:hypothetical protein OOK47_56620 [Streptomyces sp. NBC_00268]|nr:hypothetical protein [Streptomyces sp. NBC_00268]
MQQIHSREAVASGASANGEPWQYYDLGHGWCTYTLFERCRHRMACSRCDFYTPKESSKGQLLEAKDNLQKMPANIQLTADERAAVDDGQTALDKLLERLADSPTPTGPTPRQIGAPATLLPVIDLTTRTRSCRPGSRAEDPSNIIQVWDSTRRCQSHPRDLDERARRLRPDRPYRPASLRHAPDPGRGSPGARTPAPRHPDETRH